MAKALPSIEIRAANVPTTPSALGKRLRRLSERIAASGEKQLTRRELGRELAERRGGQR